VSDLDDGRVPLVLLSERSGVASVRFWPFGYVGTSRAHRWARLTMLRRRLGDPARPPREIPAEMALLFTDFVRGDRALHRRDGIGLAHSKKSDGHAVCRTCPSVY